MSLTKNFTLAELTSITSKFDVDIDFINKPTKFTTSAVAINRCYNMKLRNIKSNYERALKNNS